MSIFQDIAARKTRLKRGEDALIWRMRAAGRDWPEIEAALLERRAKWAERGRAMFSRYHAQRWRDQLRRERAAG